MPGIVSLRVGPRVVVVVSSTASVRLANADGSNGGGSVSCTEPKTATDPRTIATAMPDTTIGSHGRFGPSDAD